jgi:IS30 family transposase
MPLHTLPKRDDTNIYILKKAEYSQAKIVELPDRDKSTISRAPRRNQGLKGYRPIRPIIWLWHIVTPRPNHVLVIRPGNKSRHWSARDGAPDNGREFAYHEGMIVDLETRIYYAHPYAYWEHGLCENTNGLVRQHFPKHCDLTTVTERKIEQAMDKLNHRPRKSPGIRTLHGVFFNTRTSLTVVLQS